jgi:hypothetical protein
MKKSRPPGMKPPRPGAVVVAGWCAILFVPLILVRVTGAVLNGQLLAAISSGVTDPASWLSTQGIERLALLLVAPIAVLSLVAGIAILSLKRWAWVLLMMVLVLALGLNLVRSFFAQPEYGLMLIYAVLAFILNQPDVRQAFRIGRPSNEPVE